MVWLMGAMLLVVGCAGSKASTPPPTPTVVAPSLPIPQDIDEFMEIVYPGYRQAPPMSDIRMDYIYGLAETWSDATDLWGADADQVLDIASAGIIDHTFGFIEHAADPREPHLYAVHYDWDQGIDPLIAIADHPRCDKATALYLYWGSGPEWFLQYTSAAPVAPHAEEMYAFMKSIERRYLNNSYTSSGVGFDPTGWAGSYEEQRGDARLPQQMYRPVDGVQIE